MEDHKFFIGPEKNWLTASSRELIFGMASLVVGMFFANMVVFGGFRLGFAIAAVAAVGLCWGYLHRAGHKGNWYTGSILVLVMLIAAGFGWSGDGFVKFVLIQFVLVGGHLALCLMTGQNRWAPGGFRSVFDGIRPAFTIGFGKMGYAARGIVMVFRSGSETARRSGAVLAGIGMAIPALAVMIPLLMASDAAFEGLIDLLPDFDLYEIVVTVGFGAFWGLYLYTLAAYLNLGDWEGSAKTERQGLSRLTMNTALGAVCGVYVAYLVSQLAYFSGGFSGILPQGYTAAEYARRGFFEMAWLCAINLGLITFGVGLVQKDGTAPLSTRVLCAFLGAVTLFLVAAGVAKMILYIGMYGLTRLRVLTMVIMAFLAVTTVLVSVWLFVPKLQYMKAVVLVALALGAAVIWADVDSQVAKYNVHAYLGGELARVDVDYLAGLGSGAVPYLQELTGCDDAKVAQQAKDVLEYYWVRRPEDFRSVVILDQRALEILDEYQHQEAAQ